MNTDPVETDEDYTGHELDGETQLHYAGARYYMSALGRWTSTDPAVRGNPAGLLKNNPRLLTVSPYDYTYGNPVNLVDPDGRAPADPDPLLGLKAIATAVYDVKHAARNLILNSSLGRAVVGAPAPEQGMKWEVRYATDSRGNRVFETETVQVPKGSTTEEVVDTALDVLTVGSGNPLGGGARGLLARSGMKGEAGRSVAREISRLSDEANGALELST